jgi:hypothetical protein
MLLCEGVSPRQVVKESMDKTETHDTNAKTVLGVGPEIIMFCCRVCEPYDKVGLLLKWSAGNTPATMDQFLTPC